MCVFVSYVSLMSPFYMFSTICIVVLLDVEASCTLGAGSSVRQLSFAVGTLVHSLKNISSCINALMHQLVSPSCLFCQVFQWQPISQLLSLHMLDALFFQAFVNFGKNLTTHEMQYLIVSN